MAYTRGTRFPTVGGTRAPGSGAGGGTGTGGTKKPTFSWQGNGLGTKDLGTGIRNDFATLWGQGPGEAYDKSLYAGLGGTTNNALADILKASGQNTGYFNNAIDYAGGLVKDGGLTDDMSSFMDRTSGVASAFGKLANTDTQKAAFERDLTRTLGDATTGIGSAIGSMGRYGSGMHVAELGDTLGGISDKARLGERDAGFNRTATALNGQLGALGSAFGMGQTGVSNAMTAGNNLGSLYQQQLLPGQTQLGVGQLQDADKQAKLLANYDLFNRNQNHTKDWMSGMMGMFGQAPAAEKKSNPLMDFLGLAGTAASVFL